MTNEVTTIDTNNYAAMAKAMGMGDTAGEKKTSALARLRINHTPVMGQAEVKGKQVNVEVVEGGTYKLEIPDGPVYFAEKIKVRPFLQRFMYKKFVMGSDTTPNRYVKTVMGDNLNSDMKDNDGGFNCGKPSGWIEDFNSLPDSMKELIRSIKRVRVLFGTVDMVDSTDAQGNPVEAPSTPFIYEVENRDAFKIIGSWVRCNAFHHSTTLTALQRSVTYPMVVASICLQQTLILCLHWTWTMIHRLPLLTSLHGLPTTISTSLGSGETRCNMTMRKSQMPL